MERKDYKRYSREFKLEAVRLAAVDAGIYRLRLAADGETIEWWSRGPDGKLRFTAEVPDITWTLQMQQILLEPLVAEELL